LEKEADEFSFQSKKIVKKGRIIHRGVNNSQTRTQEDAMAEASIQEKRETACHGTGPQISYSGESGAQPHKSGIQRSFVLGNETRQSQQKKNGH